MKKSKTHSYDVSEAYREAKWAISGNGNRMTLISALGILMLCGMLYYCLYAALSAVAAVLMVEESLKQILLTAVYLPLVLLLTLFLTLPLLQGFLLLARDMVRGEETELFGILRPFSQGRLYRRCLGLAFGAVWRLGLLILCMVGTYRVTLYYFKGSLLAGLVCAMVILAELFVGLILCTRTYAALYFAAEDGRMPLRAVRRRARELQRAVSQSALRYYAYFLPRILLGLATLGIYLLADVLPMMALTYFCDCDRRVRFVAEQPEDDMNLEDIKNYE